MACNSINKVKRNSLFFKGTQRTTDPLLNTSFPGLQPHELKWFALSPFIAEYYGKSPGWVYVYRTKEPMYFMNVFDGNFTKSTLETLSIINQVIDEDSALTERNRTELKFPFGLILANAQESLTGETLPNDLNDFKAKNKTHGLKIFNPEVESLVESFLKMKPFKGLYRRSFHNYDKELVKYMRDNSSRIMAKYNQLLSTPPYNMPPGSLPRLDGYMAASWPTPWHVGMFHAELCLFSTKDATNAQDRVELLCRYQVRNGTRVFEWLHGNNSTVNRGELATHINGLPTTGGDPSPFGESSMVLSDDNITRDNVTSIIQNEPVITLEQIDAIRQSFTQCTNGAVPDTCRYMPPDQHADGPTQPRGGSGSIKRKKKKTHNK